MFLTKTRGFHFQHKPSFGRKRTTQIPMFLAGLFCALVATISEDDTNQRKISLF